MNSKFSSILLRRSYNNNSRQPQLYRWTYHFETNQKLSQSCMCTPPTTTTMTAAVRNTAGPVHFQQRNNIHRYIWSYPIHKNRLERQQLLATTLLRLRRYFHRLSSSTFDATTSTARSFSTTTNNSSRRSRNYMNGEVSTTERKRHMTISTKQELIDNDKTVTVKKASAPFETTTTNVTTTTTTTTTEMKKTWIEQYVPKSYQPYAYLARLDKPIGTMLLFWPCAWSIGLATTPCLAAAGDSTELMFDCITTNLYTMSLFGIGAIVMRGAGCTINDLWDRKYDQHVARTNDRPLVNGSVTPKQAIQFVLLQSSIGLCVLLSLQPHVLDCLFWGCLSLPLVVVYPTMKRFFAYPQLVLGMTFNWGVILGWIAVHGSSNVDWTIVGPLYGSGITWTLIYDTLYAHQDKKDDAKLQLHSTALSFGPHDDRQRVILHGLAALTWAQWLIVGYTAFDTHTAFIPYYSLGVSLAYSHLIWQIQTADFDNPANLAQRFRSNNTTGAIVAGAIGSALAAQILC